MNRRNNLLMNARLLIAIREYTSSEEKVKNVQQYLDEGADINNIDKNDSDNTCLHVAVLENEPEIVRLLLDRGATVDIKNSDGKTAYDIAKQLQYLSIIEIFLNFSVSSEFVSQKESNKNFNKDEEAKNVLGEGVTHFLKQNKSLSRKKYRKQGLHGDIYQLKLLMLFLKRGLDKGFRFRLGTERKEARKFDDLVFEIINKNNTKEYTLLQAKHKEDESKQITFDDLLTESDSDYSLVKYFFSYKDCKNEALFKEGIIKDITVCTNINFDFENCLNGNIIMDMVHKIENSDSILNTMQSTLEDEPVLHRFNKNIISLLKPAVTSFNLTRLAKRLVKCFLKNNPIQHHNKNDVFETYHTILAKEVIDVDKKKFFANFVNGYNTLSTEAKRFREIFKAELKKQSEGMSLAKVNSAIFASKISFNLSKGFGNAQRKQKFIYNGQIPNLAKLLIERILKSKTINTKGILGSYHALLAESIIDVNKGKFHDEFIYCTVMSEDIDKFRKYLEKESLKQGELSLEEINKAVEDNRSRDNVGLNLSAGFGIGSNNNWPRNAISDEDINEFIDKLLFAVNQPNEEQLGEIIENEISKEFNFPEGKYIYDKLLLKILDWLKGKGEDFISNEDGKRFFDDVKTKLCELKLTYVTLDFKRKMKDYNINFNLDTALNLKLSEFLTSESQHKQILNVLTKCNTLSSIKMCQILNSIAKYKEDDSYILMKLDSIYRLQDYVMQAFKGNFDLLIINCKISERNIDRDTDQLFSHLCNIIFCSNNKKVILITQENDSLANKFKNDSCIRNKYEEITDDGIQFHHLTSGSRKTFLEDSKIIFQGKEVSLSILIDNDTEYLIDEELLTKIIYDETVVIGKIPSGFHEVKQFYIHRKFMISNSSDSEVVYGVVEAPDNSLTYHKTNFPKHKNYSLRGTQVPTGDTTSSEKFTYIHLNKSNLKKNKGNSLSNRPDKRIHERKVWNGLELKDIADNVVILADEPGSGKSTMIFYIADQLKESDHSLWVEIINLNDHTKALHYIEFDNWDKVANFLMNVVNLKTTLEKELFKHRIFEDGKIILLFDGFDEICPDYKKKVIKLLKWLKDTKLKQLWVTTRPHMIRELTIELNNSSYYLMPLSPPKQRELLMKYFSHSCQTASELDLNFYTIELLRLVSRSFDCDIFEFLNIPLHLRMIAEAFQENLNEYCNSSLDILNLPENLDLLHFYELFIHRKFDIYCKEKDKADLTKPNINESCEKLRADFIRQHKLASVVALFQFGDVRILLSEEELMEVTDFIRTVKEGKERTGIISNVIDNRPRFIHQTYAEYFAVELISDKIKLSQSQGNTWTFLKRKNYLKDYSIIRKFFKYKIEQNRDLESYLDSKEKAYLLYD